MLSRRTRKLWITVISLSLVTIVPSCSLGGQRSLIVMPDTSLSVWQASRDACLEFVARRMTKIVDVLGVEIAKLVPWAVSRDFLAEPTVSIELPPLILQPFVHTQMTPFDSIFPANRREQELKDTISYRAARKAEMSRRAAELEEALYPFRENLLKTRESIGRVGYTDFWDCLLSCYDYDTNEFILIISDAEPANTDPDVDRKRFLSNVLPRAKVFLIMVPTGHDVGSVSALTDVKARIQRLYRLAPWLTVIAPGRLDDLMTIMRRYSKQE